MLAAVAAVVLLPAAPATADDPADLQLNVQQGNLQSQAGGQPTTLVFSVTNNGPGRAGEFVANVTIPFGDKGVYLASSSPQCDQNGGPTVLACRAGELEAGQSTVFTLVIGAPAANTLAATDSFSSAGGIQIVSSNGSDPNGSNDSGQFTLSLTGAPPTVTSITGTVADGSTGNPIVGASVVSRDVNGTVCPATTDAAGAFTCSPNPGLAGGQITVEATMAGYQLSRTSVTPTNGAVANIQLALNPVAASPSPTPSLAPSTPAAVSSPQPQALKSNDGFPWDALLLVVGIVIALAALGGGGWWIYRRKDSEPPPDGPQPDLVGAESLLPTMGLWIPNGDLSQTTVATQQPFGTPPPFGAAQPGQRPELPAGAGATAVWGAAPGTPGGAGTNASTAVWGADAGQPQSGGWSSGGNPSAGWSPELAAQVNRSTEPIPVSGGGTGWSAGPANSGDGERTAEWSTIDPGPGQQAEPATPSAVNQPTAAWPPPSAPQSAPPYTPQSGPPYTPPPFPASAPPAPGSAPPVNAQARPADRYYPAEQRAHQSETADPYSWGAARPAATHPSTQAYSTLPAESPAQSGYYGGATPGAPTADWDTPPTAGWDTPPAVVPQWQQNPPPPYPTSGPPLGARPISTPPTSGSYPPPAPQPDYGNYHPAAPEPAEPDPHQWWSDQNPRR